MSWPPRPFSVVLGWYAEINRSMRGGEERVQAGRREWRMQPYASQRCSPRPTSSWAPPPVASFATERQAIAHWSGGQSGLRRSFVLVYGL